MEYQLINPRRPGTSAIEQVLLNRGIQDVQHYLNTVDSDILSPLDLELVHKWINEDKFSYDKIYNAVIETLKSNRKSIQYVDIILNKKSNESKSSQNEGLQDLFNQVYGKIK